LPRRLERSAAIAKITLAAPPVPGSASLMQQNVSERDLQPKMPTAVRGYFSHRGGPLAGAVSSRPPGFPWCRRRNGGRSLAISYVRWSTSAMGLRILSQLQALQAPSCTTLHTARINSFTWTYLRFPDRTNSHESVPNTGTNRHHNQNQIS
jgi:hypothetical protein